MSATVRDGRSSVLAVSMGDPAGIGPEITLRAWLERGDRNIAPFAVFADPNAFIARAEALSLAVPIQPIDKPEAAADVFTSALPVCSVPLAAKPRPGEPNPANAPAIIESIERATDAVVQGAASAVVTNPIAKHVLHSSSFSHPGHTEFLAALAERHFPGKRYHPVMMLASNELRVVPLTIHCALSEVPGAITRRLIFETVRTTFEALSRDFRISAPRIAVTGLNPHCGEGGRMGHEEADVIAPAIAELRSEGLSVTGPHPADTLFHAAARRTYDAVIAMYHDQALIPFKTIAFHDGVNVTLGLPFIRTSPDHGTAFDIATKGCASPVSFIEALRTATELATSRRAASAA